MLLAFPLLLPLGIFVPGFLIAKGLRHSLWWASAFPVSLLVLFHSIFWLGIFHIPITVWTVLPCLLAASAAAAWFGRKSALPARLKAAPWTIAERILLASSGVVSAALAARCAISPSIGPDTPFRWDFLAQKLLALGRFDFYPPLTPADFRTYFYVDGIPPLVSFTNWWFYASAGRHLPGLISLFAAAQFVCTLAFAYGTAAAIFSRRAGVLAAAILAACPLYFRAVVLEQETGLTALAIAAMLYFIVTAREGDDVRAMVSAGLSAALCALAREYGWIALIAGIVALLWRRQPLKQMLVFAGVAVAAAAPWYVRNWLFAGNPFYSLRFGDFAVNPVHDGIMQHYKSVLGVGQWGAGTWTSLVGLLLLFATLQVLAGIPGGLTRFRQNGYLAATALLLAAVWLQSAGYTSAGIETSTRVLSPALVVLSITAAGLLASWASRANRLMAVAAVIVAFQVWTAAGGMVYPNDPLSLPVAQWPRAALQRTPEPAEFQIGEQLAPKFPVGYRLLSDNAYLHAALVDKGIEVVPVWSPEVNFLFHASAEESERRLVALRIVSVAYYPQSLNSGYLAFASPFYASLTRRWRVWLEVPNFMYVLVPQGAS